MTKSLSIIQRLASKTTHNELQLCVEEFLQSKIVEKIKEQAVGSYYGIQCDKVTTSATANNLVWYYVM